MKGTWVWSLVQENPQAAGQLSAWATTAEPTCCACWRPQALEPVLHSQRSHRDDRHAHCALAAAGESPQQQGPSTVKSKRILKSKNLEGTLCQHVNYWSVDESEWACPNRLHGWMASLTQWTSLSKSREILKNREAWCVAVHGVAKSRTWLSDFYFTMFHKLSFILHGYLKNWVDRVIYYILFLKNRNLFPHKYLSFTNYVEV